MPAQAICGARGRWKNNLIAQCVRAGRPHDDHGVAPVVRQTLQHWAYRLTVSDHDAYAASLRAGARAAFIRPETMAHVVDTAQEEQPLSVAAAAHGDDGAGRPQSRSRKASSAAAPDPTSGGWAAPDAHPAGSGRHRPGSTKPNEQEEKVREEEAAATGKRRSAGTRRAVDKEEGSSNGEPEPAAGSGPTPPLRRSRRGGGS